MEVITIKILKKDKNKLLAFIEELGGEVISTSINKEPKEILGFNSFSGIWSAKEADEIEHIITQSCEVIRPDDWK